MSTPSPETVRSTVRDTYAAVAKTSTSCCAPACCTPAAETNSLMDAPANAEALSLGLGYSATELAMVPDDANLGLGCGNPHAFASLSPGETVLDLGSGPGLDCLIAAKAVGPEGSVIGVDMTPAMLDRARATAADSGASNVDFRLGTIEHLPVADSTVDVILSNCVINLSPEKEAVFSEALRVLKPGGRLAIKDIVATAPIPEELKSDFEALTGCVAGAAPVDEITQILRNLGFAEIEVDVDPSSRDMIDSWMPGRGAGDVVASASIRAVRPETV
ncbi:MAG: arsenite methyltransferase [Deltaproteobacteria bacterium]|nr:arsenite methyltransferase [Deltaproteobacteria bacterium]